MLVMWNKVEYNIEGINRTIWRKTFLYLNTRFAVVVVLVCMESSVIKPDPKHMGVKKKNINFLLNSVGCKPDPI